VKSPLGGYCESVLSAGETMRSLAYFEAKVVPGEPIQVRVRGASSTEAQALLDLYRKTLRLDEKLGPGELVCEVTANLEVDPEIASDPEFWPRMVLLPGSRIMFRARDPDELLRCAKVLEFVARSEYQVDHCTWAGDVQITGGTVHKIGLRFDPQCVRRVAAKIAYALFCEVTKKTMNRSDDERMRSYILSPDSNPNEPVWIAPDPVTWTTSNDPHFILLSPPSDRSAVLVRLYCFTFRVEIGEAGILPDPIGVICEMDGSGMRMATEKEVVQFLAETKDAVFSRPYSEPLSEDA
jgi:hypothetical protein